MQSPYIRNTSGSTCIVEGKEERYARDTTSENEVLSSKEMTYVPSKTDLSKIVSRETLTSRKDCTALRDYYMVDEVEIPAPSDDMEVFPRASSRVLSEVWLCCGERERDSRFLIR